MRHTTTVPGPRPAGGRPRVAAALTVVCWSLTVLSLVLQAASGRGFATGDVLFLVVDATVSAVYGTVGAVIVARRRHVVGWLVALTGVGGGVSALGGGWEGYAASHPAAPALEPLASAYGWAWVPGTIALFTVVPWLVRDHPLRPAERAGLGLGIAAVAAMSLTRVVWPATDTDVPIVLAVAAGLVTAGATWWRGRRGPVVERRGLGLLALGTAAMAVSFLPLLVVETSPDILLAVPLTHLACQALFPAALLVSVLRNRLWGLDLVVSRATVAALLTLGLAVVYAAVTVTAGAVVGSRPVAQAVAAVGVALALNPARSWLARRVDLLVHGDGGDPGRAALRVGAHLAAPGGDLLADLAASVGEALRLESVALAAPDPVDRVVTWGVATSEPTALPLRQGGRTVGELRVTPRPGERLDARSHDALAHLLPVVGAGLALAHAAAELERARDAATQARLAERRLVRREIHDGLGPWLSGLRLGLQGAVNLAERDPAAARALLDELATEAGRRVEDVRALSRSLLPPVLDELGLEAALGELVLRHAAEGFEVELVSSGCTGLTGSLAAAGYAVAAEAVLNAARHSGAAGCRLAVVRGTEALEVVCEDTGRGPGEGAAGVGTTSMRERARERGGTLRIDDLAPGTRVHAVLPVAARPRAGALP